MLIMAKSRFERTGQHRILMGCKEKKTGQSCKTICMVERQRQFDEKTESETSYYIGSIGDDAKGFAHAVRSHWSIENSLHWVLDVTFREWDNDYLLKILNG